MDNIYSLIGRNLKWFIVFGTIGVLIVTGAYNLDRFINITEQVLLNLSNCAK